MVEEQEPSPLKEDPRDFALWKAQKAHEDAAVGLAVGARGVPAGTSSARRWRRSSSATSSRSTAAGSTSASRTTRTSSPSRARSAARSRGSGCTTGCSSWTREKMSKSLGNDVSSATCSTRGDARRCSCSTSPDTGASRSTSRTRRWRPRLRAPRASARSSAGAHEPAPAGAWERFAAALDDDFNTPAALAVMHEWRDHELLRRALGIFGLESLAEDDQRRPRSSCSPSGAWTLARPRVRRGRPAPRRDRGRRAGTCATRPTASGSSAGDDAHPRARLRTERRARALPRAAAGPRDLGDRARSRPDPVARCRPAPAGEAGADPDRGGGDA